MQKNSRVINARLKFGNQSLELPMVDFGTALSKFAHAWSRIIQRASRWSLWSRPIDADKPCYRDWVLGRSLFADRAPVSRHYDETERDKLAASGFQIDYAPGMMLVRSSQLPGYRDWKRFEPNRSAYRGSYAHQSSYSRFYEFEAHLSGNQVCLHTGNGASMVGLNDWHLIAP